MILMDMCRHQWKTFVQNEKKKISITKHKKANHIKKREVKEEVETHSLAIKKNKIKAK